MIWCLSYYYLIQNKLKRKFTERVTNWVTNVTFTNNIRLTYLHVCFLSLDLYERREFPLYPYNITTNLDTELLHINKIRVIRKL